MKKPEKNKLKSSKHFWYENENVFTIRRNIIHTWEAVMFEVCGISFPVFVITFFSEIDFSNFKLLINSDSFIFGLYITLLTGFCFFFPIISFIWKPKVVEFHKDKILYYKWFKKTALQYTDVNSIVLEKIEDLKFGRVNFVDIYYKLKICTNDKMYTIARVSSSYPSKELEELKILLDNRVTKYLER